MICIPDRFTCRGITFLSNGQQCTLGVDPGDYDDMGETEVSYTDLGKPARSPAVMLVNRKTGEKWYVGISTAIHLREACRA